MAAKIDNNQSVLKTRSIVPTTPSSGDSLLYVNSSKLYRQIDDAGVERAVANPTIDIQDKSAGTSVTGATELRTFDNLTTTYRTADLLVNTLPMYTNRMWVDTTANQIFSGGSLLGQPTNGNFVGGKTLIDYTTTQSARLLTQTTANVNFGITTSGDTSNSQFYMDSACEILMYCKMRTYTSLSNIAFMIGVLNANATADDIGSTQGVYFRYSTSASDAGWIGVVHASSANRNLSSNLANIATSTDYELLMYLSSDGVRFSVNGAAPTLVAYPTGFGSVVVGPQITVLTRDTNVKGFEIYQAHFDGK